MWYWLPFGANIYRLISGKWIVNKCCAVFLCFCPWAEHVEFWGSVNGQGLRTSRPYRDMWRRGQVSSSVHIYSGKSYCSEDASCQRQNDVWQWCPHLKSLDLWMWPHGVNCAILEELPELSELPWNFFHELEMIILETIWSRCANISDAWLCDHYSSHLFMRRLYVQSTHLWDE